MGWVGIDYDYPVSIKEVLDITAETGALTTQSRIRELKPYRSRFEVTDKDAHWAEMAVKCDLDKVPSVTLERKNGKWVNRKLIYSDISIATCTTCGKRVPVGNFCIDCGSYNGGNKKRSND